MRLTSSRSHHHDADNLSEPARSRDQAEEAEQVDHEVHQLASGQPAAPAPDIDDGATEGDTILPEQGDAARPPVPEPPIMTAPVVEAQPKLSAPEPAPPEPPKGQSDAPGAARPASRPLGELLVGRGLVSEDQLRDALTKQTASGKRLGNLLVDLDLLDERALTDVLAEQLGLTVVDLSRAEIDPEIVALLPEDDARRLGAMPTHRDGSRIEVAVADPLVEDLDTELIEILGSLVRIKLAVRSDLEQALNRAYAPAADLGDALRMFEARLASRKASQAPDTFVQNVVDENAPVVKIVNVILEQAVQDRASDVHIEPMADSVRVRVRTDGALHQITTLPGPMGPSLVSRIKVMSDMNIVERRRPQDGQMAITVGNRELDVRVSTMPTAFGEKCVMRILDKTRAVIELPALGMSPETYATYYDLIRSPYGMVICAGPTGSGKTTTLYATLTAINNDDINLVTIEDPVEYVFPTINQIQINEPAGLTFASSLRSVLRQDPDAILVGEIRDVETARIATQAALTGHFVVSSLHATDATSALHRFMDMGIEPFLIASSLLGVVGQRLIRRVCEHCTEPYTLTPEERMFYERGGGSVDGVEFVAGVGCNFCGQTGFYDRIGVYEVLRVTDEMKELIVTDAPHAALRALAIEQGMTTLRDQAIRLVTEGKTTVAEVVRTVYVLYSSEETGNAMPTYRFVAVGPDGSEIKDALEAPSEDALRNQLLMRNLEVTSVKQKKKFNELELSPQRVPKQEIMHFSRQMAAFVRTGIPITEALEVVEDGSGNKRFRQILSSMREQINNGVPFSDAIAEHARVFPPYYIGILKSAELTGQLDVSLEQLSSYMERDLDSRSKIKAAMIYPAVIFGMSLMTVVILAVWVMPKFVVFFKNLDAKLPLPTMLLINMSDAAQKLWFVWVGLMIAFAAVMAWMHRSPKGRLVRDKMFLRVPLVKDVVLFAVTERVCRIIGAMVKAGVPLPETLNAAIQGANNQVFERGLVTARDRMLEGEGLAEPIADTHLFPRAAGQMMRVGEDTGTLDIQLENAAEYYGRELEYKLKKLTSLFEPAVIIAMGLIVGFVAVALISAMYGVFNSSKMLNTGPKV